MTRPGFVIINCCHLFVLAIQLSAACSERLLIFFYSEFLALSSVRVEFVPALSGIYARFDNVKCARNVRLKPNESLNLGLDAAGTAMGR